MAYTYKGKTYKTKALMQKAQGDVKGTPTKNTGSFFDKFIKGDKFKNKKGSKASIASGKSNADATSKMYAAESMFNTAKARDDAKVKPGKARSFKDAFDAANKADKDKFLHKGKSYFTTKGAADNRDKMKTRTGEAGSMSSAKPTGPNKPKRTIGGLLKKLGSKLKKKK
jgi:hypothetical protein